MAYGTCHGSAMPRIACAGTVPTNASGNTNVNVNIDNSRNTVVRRNTNIHYNRPPYRYGGYGYYGYHPYHYHPYHPYYWGPRITIVRPYVYRGPARGPFRGPGRFGRR